MNIGVLKEALVYPSLPRCLSSGCATTSAEKPNMQYSVQTHTPGNVPRANTENVNERKAQEKNRGKKERNVHLVLPPPSPTHAFGQ